MTIYKDTYTQEHIMVIAIYGSLKDSLFAKVASEV